MSVSRSLLLPLLLCISIHLTPLSAFVSPRPSSSFSFIHGQRWYHTVTRTDGGVRLRLTNAEEVVGRPSSSVSAVTIEEELRFSVPQSSPPPQSQQQTLNGFAPVLSAAALITGNTVGAGCLVMPQVAAPPGFGPTLAVFLVAYSVNLLSAVLLSEIAIAIRHDRGSVPSSFNEFAGAVLPETATLIRGLSVFVNSCVLAFDVTRAGALGHACAGLPVPVLTSTVALALVGILTTQGTPQISTVCSVLVSVVLTAFCGLLVPGLLHVADPIGTILTPGTESVWGAAPIILVSMIFQNIVPTVTKLLDYDRGQTRAALVLGSAIPLCMYLGWILACLGGGIDQTNLGGHNPLLTVFSLATVAGSTICTGVSLSEEMSHDGTQSKDEPFDVTTVLAAVAVPVGLGVSGVDTTQVLGWAGSFGSPVLYGILPAVLYSSLQQQRRSWMMSPVVLGVASGAFVLQEAWCHAAGL